MAGHSYLLDTNILSDLIKHPSGTVARRIAVVGENAVCTSTLALFGIDPSLLLRIDPPAC